MLVLTRKKTESVMIGREIEITVLEITPTQIRLGVEAPAHYPIFRKEIFLEIEAANRQAAQPALPVAQLGDAVKKLFPEWE